MLTLFEVLWESLLFRLAGRQQLLPPPPTRTPAFGVDLGCYREYLFSRNRLVTAYYKPVEKFAARDTTSNMFPL